MAKKTTDRSVEPERESKRQQTTTRIYVDSLAALRMIADQHGISVLDYLDILAREAMRREGPDLIDFVKRMSEEEKSDGKEK
jgi:hypothetical protein